MKKQVVFLGLFFLFFGNYLFPQQKELDRAAALISNFEMDSSLVLLRKVDTTHFSSFEKGRWHLYFSEVALSKDAHGNSFRHARKAKTYFMDSDSLGHVFQTNLLLLEITSHQEKLDFDDEPILAQLKTYIDSHDDALSAARLYARTATKYLYLDDAKKSLYFYDKSISELKKIDDSFRVAVIEMNKGAVHATITKKLDSALYYYKKSLPFLQKKNRKHSVVFNYNNQAGIYKDQKKYAKSLEYYQLANDIKFEKNQLSTKLIFYENLMDLYEKMGDYKNAYAYSVKTKMLSDSLNNTEQNIAISQIQTKYETEKKEKENLQLKTEIGRKSRAQQMLWGGLGLSIVIGAMISLLIFKNAKKRRMIANQERKLELQQVEKNLKDQELNTIDHMIAGQEKERQRLAEDLHDNLGGTLATLRLNFKNIQKNLDKEEAKPVLENATILIDDAYKKVREIAHEKNSGVMAKEGLLPAVKTMARKISAAKEVQIEVQDFGLEKRLENTMEIAVFRIIQELTTNIVKHAHATEATISITNHEDLLNIIVEDNGKGFNSKKAMKNDGMGLANIEKRIERLEGTLQIDSSKHKGTSVIIDIPL